MDSGASSSCPTWDAFVRDMKITVMMRLVRFTTDDASNLPFEAQAGVKAAGDALEAGGARSVNY